MYQPAMSDVNPGRNWLTVRDTAHAVQYGTNNLSTLPRLLRELFETEAWRYFALPTGELVEHARFADFVAARAPRVLETEPRMLEKIADAVEDEAQRVQLRDLLDRALQNPEGNPGTVDNMHSRPAGTSQQAALRRLRKDSPELHADVLAGRLSAHAAMVQADSVLALSRCQSPAQTSWHGPCEST